MGQLEHDRLDDGIGVLSAGGRKALEQPWSIEPRRTYEELKFVQLDAFVRGDLLTEIVRDALPALRKYATRTVKPHEIRTGYLGGGRRFDRIDWGRHEGNQHSEDDKRAIRAIFDSSGLTGFVTDLLTAVQPLFEYITGRRLSYDRVFLLDYHEADFIGPHGDTQTSRRVLVQIPVVFNCRTAFRVLKDGWMEPFYDDPSCVRLMGPGIWHDVLPVLRLGPEEPERVVVTARLPYADGDE